MESIAMRRLAFTIMCLSTCLGFGSLSVAHAQQASSASAARPATIPLEVAFIYAKLLNAQPDFQGLAASSPTVQNTPEFGRDALITQERHSLEQIFKTTKRDSLITVHDNFAIDTIAPSLQNLQFKGIDADTPFTFDAGNATYGVFIRNAATLVTPLQAPFYKGSDWVTLQKLSLTRQPAIVEMTLQPLGADSANFTTFKDQIVKPIIADLIEIKVFDPADPSRVLLDKRDDKAFAKANSQLENLVQDDVKDDSLNLPNTPSSAMPPASP